MRSLDLVATIVLGLMIAGCRPSWPRDEFPAEMDVKRTLFAGGTYGMREACEAMVVEMSDVAAMRVVRLGKSKGVVVAVPPPGWSDTPISAASMTHSYFEGAFGGCKGDEHPLGDLPGALKQPGSFYKVLDGGEGIAIILPRAKLAGYFYFG